MATVRDLGHHVSGHGPIAGGEHDLNHYAGESGSTRVDPKDDDDADRWDPPITHSSFFSQKSLLLNDY